MKQLLTSQRGEIAGKLTLIAVLVISLGFIIGTNSKRFAARTTTYAASTCAYTFSNPTLTQLEGRLICTVPTSGRNIPSIGCSLAKNSQWVADSSLLGGEGTSMQFELTLLTGYGPGTYDLIAYEFDQYCSHEDKVVQVAVTSDILIPTPLPTQFVSATPTPTLSPTPVPECILQGQGDCMSQALCLAGVSNQNLGDLGCSALRSDWICCLASNAPTRTLIPTSTPVSTIVPTEPVLEEPTPTTPGIKAQSASENVLITKTESCFADIQIAANNRQSWAYRVGNTGIYEVVPVLGATDKQQLVDAKCE